MVHHIQSHLIWGTRLESSINRVAVVISMIGCWRKFPVVFVAHSSSWGIPLCIVPLKNQGGPISIVFSTCYIRWWEGVADQGIVFFLDTVCMEEFAHQLKAYLFFNGATFLPSIVWLETIHLQTNVATENRPSQKETSLPTTISQGLC